MAKGWLTRSQLDHAIDQQRKLKLPLGKVLRKLEYVTDERIRQTLSMQLGVPFIDLDKMAIDRQLSRLINRSYAKRHAVLPIAHLGDVLTVVMDDPTAMATIEDLRRLTQATVTVVTAGADAFRRGFGRLYDEAPEEADASVEPGLLTIGGQQDTLNPVVIDEQSSKRADELFRAVLFRALQERTSDLHLEMLPSGLQVRFRIDGVLRHPSLEGLKWPLSRSAREVVSRIKILSKLDISERRRPQDGSFRVAIERDGQKVNVDLRVSVIPSHSGESVVIRVLDHSRAPRSLDGLHLTAAVHDSLVRLLRRTTGILLVTGPTGSGKSTTLYSCLMRLHKPEIRILTAEDPVEYMYDELSQSEVNDAIGNTFAHYLRAFLRHDPEVIMVGEIRDEETAEMAFRAAQTGHFLLSTMHTNSAISALPRLLDLKIEPSLIASSLIGVLSQRLVRTVCRECARPAQPPAEQVAELFRGVPEGMTFMQGAGCPACGFSGYRGRTAIVDLWTPDEQDALLITRQAPLPDIKRSAERTTISMACDAHARLRAGETTVEELLRVLPHSAILEHRARYSAGQQPDDPQIG